MVCAMETRIGVAVLRIGTDGEAPEWVTLIPAGRMEHRGGDSYELADPDAVAAATREWMRTQDLVVDYDHQTEEAPKSGSRAPAAGWIKEVSVRDGAIVGRVEWTERAKAHIEAREYRYISPVFLYDRATRQIKSLARAGLTNSPALPEMPALARAPSMERQQMESKDLKALLGLDAAADEAAVKVRLDAIRAEGATGAVERIAAAAGLPANSTEEAVIAARAAPDPAQWIPRAQYDAVAGQLASRQTAGVESEVDALVAAGKVAPAQRSWAVGYASQDPEGFRRFAAAAPVLVQPGATTAQGSPAAGPAKLSAEERQVCSALGVSEEQFLAARVADAAANGGEVPA